MVRALKRDIVRNSLNYFIGNIGVSAISFITIPIFTRLLTPSDYGQINLFTAFLSINTIVFSLGFTGAFSNKYLKEPNEFNTFLGTNLMFLFFIQIMLLIVLLFANDYISALFKINRKVLVIANISGILMVAYNIYQSYLKASQQSKKFVTLSYVYGILSTGISILLIILLKENKYLGRIYAYIITIFILSIISVYHLIKLSNFKFQKQHLLYALGFGIPFIPHLASQFVLGSFDRIIINQLTNSINTGLYSFAYNIGSFLGALTMALTTAFVPKFYNYLNNGDYKAINHHVRVITNLVLFAALFMIFFVKEIVVIMADAKYYKALEIIPWIIVANIFFYLYMVYSVYATYDKKTGIFSLITLLVGFINIILNYFFIPLYGYEIAAITTMVSYLLLFLLHFLYAKYILNKIVIPLTLNIKSFFVFSCLILLFYFINTMQNQYSSIVLRLLLICIGGVIIFKSQLHNILKVRFENKK